MQRARQPTLLEAEDAGAECSPAKGSRYIPSGPPPVSAPSDCRNGLL